MAIYAANETEIFETDEDGVCEDAAGVKYERCWRCGEYFPENEMIVSNIDGIFCEECDEAMVMGGFYDDGIW